MKRVSVVVFLLILVPSYIFSFAYDSAVYAAQNDQWQKSHEKIHSLLVDSPDNADLLYDAGVASYNLENFSQAQIYFLRSVEHADMNDLKSRAYYNAGNAYVADKKLKEALVQYDEALCLDKDNEYIKHNRDTVARMLEQQEQEKKEQQNQEQEQKDEQKKEDQQKKEQQDQEQQDQQNKNDDSGDNGDEQDQGQQQSQDQQNKKSGSGKQDQKPGSEKNKNKKDPNSDSDDSQNQLKQSDGNEKGEEQKPKEKNKRDAGDKPENKSQDSEGKSDGNEGDEHNESPGEKKKQTDTDTVPSQDKQSQVNGEQGGQDKEAEAIQALNEKLNDPWLMSVLDKQEERDKAMNKQLMVKKIGQHGGKNGQNCW